jgi:predicted signal transduction protein with EAL and GGDEF domain
MADLNDTLIKALPDLALVVRRDGLVLSNLGGREIDVAAPPGALSGKTLCDLWPGAVGIALVRLVRRALKGRVSSEGRWQYQKTTIDVRVRPQGPDRVLMLIRSASGRISETADAATLNSSELNDPADCSRFAQHFCNALATARLRESSLALAIVYFDDLTEVERTNGAAVARTLLSCALERAIAFASDAPWNSKRVPRVAQLESDQLAVLIEEVSSHESTLATVRKMRAALAKPFSLDGRRHELSPAVGVAVYPTDGLTPESLLDCARAAVLERRRLDCDATATAHSNMATAATTSRADLEQELRWAVQQEQFSLSYLPVLELNGRRTVSLFASLEWIHPVSGRVAPECFLPLLDTLDLRATLDLWMLRRSLQDLGHVNQRGASRLNLTLKLAKRSFEAVTLVADVTTAAGAAGVSASKLDVTIDMKTLAGGSGVRERLRELRQLGARIFLQDFGQDGVALARLPALPLDGVIITSTFVARVDADPLARKVCSSAAAIAHEFGLTSLALNVRNRAQLDFLYECGCDLASGPLLADPRQIDQFSSTSPQGALK